MTAGLVLRADAGHSIGSGHVMRLVALAEAAAGRGGRARLLIGGEPAALVQALVARGLDAVAIGSATGDDPDRDQVVAAAHAQGGAPVVIDGRGFTAAYAAGIAAAGLTVASVDDLGVTPLPSAIVINHNLGAEQLAACYPRSPVRLLGRRYHLLRGEFRRLPAGGAATRAVADRVLVTMGGSDPAGATARVVAAMPGRGVHVVVVVGPDFRGDDDLAAAAAIAFARGHVVEVRRQPADLADLMASCDLAVSAGGGTLAELAYLGRPTVALAIVDDQQANVAGHVGLGLVAGGALVDGDDDRGLAGVIAALLADPIRRRDLRARAVASTDGQGADRVLDQLG